MNAQEYYLVTKMVEHANVISQYARILHDKTFVEIFIKDDHNLEADLEDLRKKMIAALERHESADTTRIVTKLELGSVTEAKL